MTNTHAGKAGPAGQAQKGKGKQDQEWFMKSYFPVLFPAHPALTMSQSDFDAFLREDLKNVLPVSPVGGKASDSDDESMDTDSASDGFTEASTTADIRDALKDLGVAGKSNPSDQSASSAKPGHPFISGLVSHDKPVQPDLTNKMRTANGDFAHRSTDSALVDLFSELEEMVSGPRLYSLLQGAWQVDSLTTLKIIFNARSIHLGKSARKTTYRCFGYLATHHPLTLVKNIQWLSRPVVEKTVQKKKSDDEDDMVLVEAEKEEDDPTRFDVRNGVAHGYWKDLLNILALSANGKLDVLSDPKTILNVEKPNIKKNRRDVNWDEDDAKHRRHDQRDDRHGQALRAFESNAVHRALHLAIARLFAEQLQIDLVRLRSGDAGARRQISLCAKWAPSQKLFHDKHTFVVSSIAEIMHPQSEYPRAKSREEYLRRAREAYRKDVASLRKVLEVVERDITAKTFEKIKYDRVPSVAMNNYASMFAEKDTERFGEYIDKVADGKKKISGAVLLPSKLIKAVRTASQPRQTMPQATFVRGSKKRNSRGIAKSRVDEKLQAIDAKVIDGQWKTLVKRIKDSGTLESSIAVCDVSGSMNYPTLDDDTTPMDSAIGLSLLLAEVTAPPFGGHFITFSTRPAVQSVKLDDTLLAKYTSLHRADWDGSTDFVAVFERLILPMAIENKLKQEDMVKQVFVFSDMQFNQATAPHSWKTSFERIRDKYRLHGYEMPKLIFWNLAGGRAGYGGAVTSYFPVGGDATVPKPVTHDVEGTAIVSGYSQGLLKMFLDSGSFEEPEEAVTEEIVEKNIEGKADNVAGGREDEDDDEMVEVEVHKKVRIDPLMTVKKAVGHKAYSMLEVFD